MWRRGQAGKSWDAALRCTEGRSRGLPVPEDVGAVALPETGQGSSGTRTLARQSGQPHRRSNFNWNQMSFMTVESEHQ